MTNRRCDVTYAKDVCRQRAASAARKSGDSNILAIVLNRAPHLLSQSLCHVDPLFNAPATVNHVCHGQRPARDRKGVSTPWHGTSCDHAAHANAPLAPIHLVCSFVCVPAVGNPSCVSTRRSLAKSILSTCSMAEETPWVVEMVGLLQ